MQASVRILGEHARLLVRCLLSEKAGIIDILHTFLFFSPGPISSSPQVFKDLKPVPVTVYTWWHESIKNALADLKLEKARLRKTVVGHWGKIKHHSQIYSLRFVKNWGSLRHLSSSKKKISPLKDFSPAFLAWSTSIPPAHRHLTFYQPESINVAEAACEWSCSCQT